MNHDPEQLAAAYLGAGMRARVRRGYETHLLTCETCWQEVWLARSGRAMAEAAREVAPAGLREDIRTAVHAATARPGPRRWPVWLGSLAAAIVAVAVPLLMLRPWQHTTATPAARPRRQSSSPVAVAVAGYLRNRLPGTAIPDRSAPDLTRIGLHLVGAAAGQVDHLTVTMFAYHDRRGDRLTIYHGTQPFPETGEAHELSGVEDAWTVRFTGVTVLCEGDTHSLLVLSADPTLVQLAANLLDPD